MPVHLIQELVKTTGASLHQKGSSDTFDSLHFDSRRILPGMGFLAIRGENMDGHDFIGMALQRGALLVIAQKIVDLPSGITLLVHENPWSVLQEFALSQRQKFKNPLIGVSGSVGKTSFKDSLKALLGPKTYASYENYNNATGLPVCLLQMPADATYGVFEMGISHPDDMAPLSRIAAPDIAALTCVYSSHRENFSTFEGLVDEKLAITKYMPPGSLLYLPEELAIYTNRLKNYAGEVRIFDLVQIQKECSSLIKSMGRGPFHSFCMAARIALDLGVSMEQIKIRQADIQRSPLRMEVRKAGNLSLLLDCYNASPESTLAFLDSLEGLENLVLVLADMLELGADSESGHQRVYDQLKRFKRVILLGPEFQKRAQNNPLPHVFWVPDKAAALLELQSKESGWIAFKGSRGFALETIASKLHNPA